MTEMGRQPWVVFGVMKTEDAVSPNVCIWRSIILSCFIHITIFNCWRNYCFLFVRIIKGHANKKTKKDYQSHDPFDKEEEYVIS